MYEALFAGFVLSFSLILAIGAQNAFVLRQGIRGEHVFATCLFCALSDAILITAGVLGFGTLAKHIPWLQTVMTYGGAAFLFWYGFLSFRSAYRGTSVLNVEGAAQTSLPKIIATLFALTWLNPHVYLDTVVLIGSVSAEFADKMSFLIGAISASFIFFFGLGYGARILRPFFARPASWRWLDVLVGVMMWTIAISLVAK